MRMIIAAIALSAFAGLLATPSSAQVRYDRSQAHSCRTGNDLYATCTTSHNSSPFSVGS